MKRTFLIFAALFLSLLCRAQQYTGMSGLIHVPSADMYNSGDARIGAHYLNHHTLPSNAFTYVTKDDANNVIARDPYNSVDFYASLTPFSWMEIGYTIILRKRDRGMYGPGEIGYNCKDQFFSLKFRPLKEGRWWPSVAIGANDPISSFKGKIRFDGSNPANQFFGNYYLALTKHFTVHNQEFGATLAYRHFFKSYNRRWNGIVGGVTYRPSFFKQGRAIVEWTGKEVNIGVDCVLFKHLMIQASLLNAKYFSGGLCYTVNLF